MKCWMLSVDWEAVSQVFGAITQGGAAVVVAVASFMALGTWRAQLHGTRQHAVAEECLCNAYQLRDMLRNIRHPITWGHEMNAVPALEGESEDERRARAPFGVVELRFAPFAEAYAAMVTSRFRVKAILGNEVHEAFAGLLSAVTDVRNAALQVLSARRDAENIGRLSPEMYAAQSEAVTLRMLQLEGLVWGSSGATDELACKVSTYVVTLEKCLKEYVAAGGYKPPQG